MKQPPKGSKFKFREFERSIFFKGVLKRLENDVESYFKFLHETNKKIYPNAVGFWASLRVLMPIIESIANANGTRVENFLKDELKIKTPYLFWNLFRHSLSHGDFLHTATYNESGVAWSVSLFDSEHIFQNNCIGISTERLYKDLKSFLLKEISKNDKRKIRIEIEIEYGSYCKEEIKEEFKLISKQE